MWNLETGECLRRIKPQGVSGPIFQFFIQDDSLFFAVHCGKSPVFKYNLASGELLACSVVKLRHVKGVVAIPSEGEEQLLVSCPKGLQVDPHSVA